MGDRIWRMILKHMKYLYNYTFHYNHHVDTWTAIPRGSEIQYWNNMTAPGMLRSKDMKTLIEIIGKLEANPNFLDKIEKS